MLELGKGWSFPVDMENSKIWLTPKGAWGLSIRCESTKVRVDGCLDEEFAPRLVIDDLEFIGSHWLDLIGLEISQHGAWHGDDDPSASLLVEQRGDLRETIIRVVGHVVDHAASASGIAFEVEVEAECDIFIDDEHDTNVPLKLTATLPFEGVQFRFRADGLDSRQPAVKATELLSQHLTPEGFGEPAIEPISPGLFLAKFPPKLEAQSAEREVIAGAPTTASANAPAEDPDETPVRELSAADRVLHQSATELLTAMVGQEWLELEDGGIAKLVPGFVDILELGGRGSRRAGRVSDWFMDQDEVIDLHVSDEDLAPILDKFW